MDSSSIIIIGCIFIAYFMLYNYPLKREKFGNPINSVTQWKYPEEAVKLSEENINIVAYNPEGVTPFFGHQNPIGAEIWYARSPMDAIESVPLSNTFVSPLCCPSEYSTSSGCLCYGNAGRILNNMKLNRQSKY